MGLKIGIPSWKVKPLLIQFTAGFCLLSGIGCTSQRAILAGDDEVSLPKREIHLSAKLQQKNIFLKDIERQPIEFHLRSAPTKVTSGMIKKELTNQDGEASVKLYLPEPGIYIIETVYAGDHQFKPTTDIITVLTVRPEKPVLVLDLDNTLTRGNWLKTKPEPTPYDKDTVRVVQKLSERYAIVYLSARPKPLHKYTRLWLQKYGFPKGPIVLWHPSRLSWLRPARFKRYELTTLRQAGVNLAVGISNTDGDIEAYHKAGLEPILLGKKNHKAQYVTSWAEIEAILLHRNH